MRSVPIHMMFLRFISIMATTTLLGLGFAYLLYGEPSESADDAKLALRIDMDGAEILVDGVGVEAIETEQAFWVLSLAKTDAEAGRMAMTHLLTHGRSDGARRVLLDGMIGLEFVDWPADHRGDFLRTLAPGAVDAALQYGVPVSVTLAQAIQESGWGRSTLATEYNNLFGVKAGSTAVGVDLQTDEVVEGRRYRTRARFRSFDTWADSIAHHGRLLGADPRYMEAQEYRTDWLAYLTRIAPVYASDPQYAERVGWFIERYELDRWDGILGIVDSHRI